MLNAGKVYGIISTLILVAGLTLSLGTNTYANSGNEHFHSTHQSPDLDKDGHNTSDTGSHQVTDKSGGQDSDSTHPGWVTEEKHESDQGELHECESHGQGPVCSKGNVGSDQDHSGGSNSGNGGVDTDNPPTTNVGGNPVVTTGTPASTPAVLNASVSTLPDTGPETSTVFGLLGSLGVGGVLKFGSKLVAKRA